ncbi:MAG: FAD-dependent oxidoreductase [Fimbriimonadaceae bacterium]|nr:FAD-dependent oxidoreductase [Fimbriimonadaceae bacterium]
MERLDCDVLVCGGGTGGVAAALALAGKGLRVVMVERYPWVGGQLTSQGVPPDEHPWIEQFGCTARYRDYRSRVRRAVQADPRLTVSARNDPRLNPGGGWVSRLCHRPSDGHAVLLRMLDDAGAWPGLDLRLGYRVESCETLGDRIGVVGFVNDEGATLEVDARFVLDATETGELLPLSGAEYVVGAESQRETDEPHALAGDAEPDNVQGLTWCAALELCPDGDFTTDRPAQYDFWRAYRPPGWPDKLLSFKMLHVQKGTVMDFPLLGNGGFNLFTYRQIVDPSLYRRGAPAPATIVNWPMNDYYAGTVLDVDDSTVSERLSAARQLTLSLVHWLQTEQGYPNLRLAGDLVGTDDGLCQAPYIRESRRVRAEVTVREQDVSPETNPGCDRAPNDGESVGVGAYRIDLHPSTNGRGTVDISALPFHIPLGALVPVRMTNLLPAGKNIGTTHVTNGCYRLHPVEWNIGEAAGLLAWFCLRERLSPQAVRATRLEDFQALCRNEGIETHWPRLGAL